MKLSELIPNDELITSNIPDIDVSDISSCCNNSTAKTVLFLLPGVNYDTSVFAKDFINASSAAIVCEDISVFGQTDIPLIEVRHARRAYSHAWARLVKVDYTRLKFIGVTGTNGKTTTATMIYRILMAANVKCGFIGTGKIEIAGERITDDYYSMTSPDPEMLYPCIKKMQEAECETVVMEVSSHALELYKVDPIPFDIGIFTGLSHEHLDFHGSMDKYLAAKEKLINSAKEVIINCDDPKGKALYDKYEYKATGIGVVFRSDRSATDVESYGLSGIGYIFRSKSFLTRINLPLPGIHNIYNSMFAFECAYKLSLSPKCIKETLFELAPIEGRCECINADITVVIDYAHTPRALESVLRAAREEADGKRKITVVFGCGGERDREKRPLMARVAERYSDFCVLTNDNPRKEPPEQIIADVSSGFTKDSYKIIPDRREAIEFAIITAKANGIVVIAGKGHEKYYCDESGYHHFDEKEIIYHALKKRSHGANDEDTT